jgi:hypothetical protein
MKKVMVFAVAVLALAPVARAEAPQQSARSGIAPAS